MAAQCGEPRQCVEIAANPEAPIARELAGVVVDRQSRQLHRQRAAAIDRPVQGDAAPGAAGGDRLGDAAVGIESERLGDVAPRRPKPAAVWAPIRRMNSSDAEREAAFGIHLPHEAQRVAARRRRGLVGPWQA